MQQDGIEFNDSERVRKRDRKGEGGRGVFRGVPRDWLRTDELGASFSCVNSRVSRKMRRGRDGKHDGDRGGAFTASTYEPTFRGRYVARLGFPDLFRNLLLLSLSLSLSLSLCLFFSFPPSWSTSTSRNSPDIFLHRLPLTDDGESAPASRVSVVYLL